MTDGCILETAWRAIYCVGPLALRAVEGTFCCNFFEIIIYLFGDSDYSVART